MGVLLSTEAAVPTWLLWYVTARPASTVLALLLPLRELIGRLCLKLRFCAAGSLSSWSRLMSALKHCTAW
jgi:hypothetical protein